MPALLPIILAGAQVVLVATQIPELNVEPTCRAAAAARTVKGRDEDSCKRDEQTARERLQQQWDGFSAVERSRCVRLSSLGGAPSYVELLTCLELAKAAGNLPPESRASGVKP